MCQTMDTIGEKTETALSNGNKTPFLIHVRVSPYTHTPRIRMITFRNVFCWMEKLFERIIFSAIGKYEEHISTGDVNNGELSRENPAKSFRQN